MRYSHSKVSNLRSPVYKAMHKNRLALISNFPINSEISFTGDDDSLGIVIKHDLEQGRLVTDKGGSFSPEDVKILKK